MVIKMSHYQWNIRVHVKTAVVIVQSMITASSSGPQRLGPHLKKGLVSPESFSGHRLEDPAVGLEMLMLSDWSQWD